MRQRRVLLGEDPVAQHPCLKAKGCRSATADEAVPAQCNCAGSAYRVCPLSMASERRAARQLRSRRRCENGLRSEAQGGFCVQSSTGFARVAVFAQLSTEWLQRLERSNDFAVLLRARGPAERPRACAGWMHVRRPGTA